MTNRVSEFAAGVAAWDERDEAVRNRWLDTLCRELPARAVNRYEERLHQLAGEFPEFAFWAHRVGVRAVLDQLYTVRQESADAGAALHSVIDLIRAGSPQAVPDKVRADLATGYRGLLDRPVAGAGDIPDEVTLPTLRELYVNPTPSPALDNSPETAATPTRRPPIRRAVRSPLTSACRRRPAESTRRPPDYVTPPASHQVASQSDLDEPAACDEPP